MLAHAASKGRQALCSACEALLGVRSAAELAKNLSTLQLL